MGCCGRLFGRYHLHEHAIVFSPFYVYLFCHLLCIDACGGVTLLKCHSLVPVLICRPSQRNRKPQDQYGDYAVMVVSLAVVLVEQEIAGRRQANIPYIFWGVKRK